MIGAFEKSKAMSGWAKTSEKTVRWFKSLDDLLEAARTGKVTGVVFETVASVAKTAKQLDDLVSELEQLKVSFHLVSEGWNPTARKVVASLAEAERASYSERQKEAVERKRERVEAGEENWNLGERAETKLTDEVRAKIYELKDAKVSVSEIARVLELSRPTVYKALKEREE